ncbi:MAG: TonB-dependent receptor [Flavobacteriaceae bacterium]|nr:TonB-dependent receptor [Flavobacteriaceae bacterium]
MKNFLSIVLVLFLGSTMIAQTAISGTVKEAKSGQPIPGANIKVVGKSLGTTTDFDGNFTFNVKLEVPFKVEVSLMGYAPSVIEVLKKNQVLHFKLKELATALDEVVVSASRTPERILESPVTIERMDARAIKNTASASFYDGLENLKGVDVNTSSLTFKSINTRGFAAFSNSRFVQLVDGMDNSSPALNFVLGNLLGLSELDVKSVELMPGASSALYGANAFNGILFMTSKNPFDHAGISAYLKTGITSQKAAGDNQFYDVGIRMAHKFSDKFAAKAVFSYLEGTEWHATNYEDFDNYGATRLDPGYDGLNVYGDEVSKLFDFDFQAGLPSGVLGSATISRTGYKEVDIMDYKASSMKANFSLHYRPMADDLEISYVAKFGQGNTIYQGANRYSLDRFFMQQHKLEISNANFFVRAYVTSEDAGKSFDSRFAAINVNRSWKGDVDWFTEYVSTYIGSKLYGGVSNEQAHATARNVADTGRLLPGSDGFKAALDKVRNDGNLTTGAKFIDETKLYHTDANYNFSHLIDFIDIQIGGSYREYSLNSEGTIFTDYDGPINYHEYGAYMQVQKKMINDRLKFTGSLRYDEAQNFEGHVSPRLSLSYSLGKEKTRNLRASFQTGFRYPTTQDQYIGLDVGRALLVGSAPDNLARYTSNPINVSDEGQLAGFPSTVQLTGTQAYENSFTLSSVLKKAPVKSKVSHVKPEKVMAFEIGYRAKFGRIALDMSGYFNEYEDFIGNTTVLAPLYGVVGEPLSYLALKNEDVQAVQLYTNTNATISSYGGTIGADTKIFGGYAIALNYTLSKFDFDQASDPDYEASFNTPEHKVKFSFGNPHLFDNFGFNVNVRWNDEYLWESTFADAIIPANTVLDAQVNYSLPKWKSTFKVGGANIGGNEYMSAPGVGSIGSQYYISWTINP